ncbi:hypothetical protein ACRAKI_13295 [Saccharothrix isguenensis]
MASHWVPAGAAVVGAVVGAVVAPATVRPWGTVIPRRLLLLITWALGAFMIVRSVGVVGSASSVTRSC